MDSSNSIRKPTVTELLDLLNKPALIGWANKQGLKGIDINKEKDKWLSAGTSLHSQIARFHLQNTPFLDPHVQEKYLQFIADKEILEVEKDIETYWFVGRLDCKLRVNDKIILCDYKSSKGVYFENKLQLIAYGMAEQCDGFAIINIPDFIFNEIVFPDRTPYEEIIESLSNIYYQKNRTRDAYKNKKRN